MERLIDWIPSSSSNICDITFVWIFLDQWNCAISSKFRGMWEILDLVSTFCWFYARLIAPRSRNSVTMTRKILHSTLYVIFNNSSYSFSRTADDRINIFQAYFLFSFFLLVMMSREICSWARERFMAHFSSSFFLFFLSPLFCCCWAFSIDFWRSTLIDSWVFAAVGRVAPSSFAIFLFFEFSASDIDDECGGVSYEFHTRTRQFIMKVKRSWTPKKEKKIALKGKKWNLKISFLFARIKTNNWDPNLCVAEEKSLADFKSS